MKKTMLLLILAGLLLTGCESTAEKQAEQQAEYWKQYEEQYKNEQENTEEEYVEEPVDEEIPPEELWAERNFGEQEEVVVDEYPGIGDAPVDYVVKDINTVDITLHWQTTNTFGTDPRSTTQEVTVYVDAFNNGQYNFKNILVYYDVIGITGRKTYNFTINTLNAGGYMTNQKLTAFYVPSTQTRLNLTNIRVMSWE